MTAEWLELLLIQGNREKYYIVQYLYPHPPTPSPREGACYRGLPPLRPCLGLRPKPHFYLYKEVYRQSEGLAGLVPTRPFLYAEILFLLLTNIKIVL